MVGKGKENDSKQAERNLAELESKIAAEYFKKEAQRE
jgi:hypothetical protein